jgi:DHA2 family multidrug resistance protein-like MFS transporter
MAANGVGVLPLALVAIGLAVGVGFVKRQRRLAHALVDLSLFRQPTFTPAVAAYGLSCFAMLGLYVLLTQYLQLVLALSPWEAGIATVPWPLATVVGSLAAPIFASRFGTRSILVAGLMTGILGIGMLAAAIGRLGLAGLEVSTVVFSAGLALVLTSAYELIVTSCPPQRSGAAAAIAETVSELGGALGIAFLGSVATAVYRHVLVTALPESLPPAAAAKALATIGGASATAAALSLSVGGPLIESARAAFSTAMQFAAVAAAVSVAAACAVAILAWRQTAGDS